MQQKLPIITVIIPTFNRKELLEKAVLSVINQKSTLPFKRELIIVDDGSTDGTFEYMRDYVSKYPNNIRILNGPNSGIPGVARNKGLNIMREDSDYVLFLDDDDEFSVDLFEECLLKREKLSIAGLYDIVLGFYFLCKNEDGKVVGEKKILLGQEVREFTYNDYLNGAINIEMGLLTKAYIFFEPIHLRFSEEVITEAVMRSKMRQYMDLHGLKILLRDYVGRIYKTAHTSEPQVTKTISDSRFLKNALGNEQVLEIVRSDLIERGFHATYADYLFRIGINYILGNSKAKGIPYLQKSLAAHFSIRVWIILLIVLCLPKKILQNIYKYYIS